MNRMKRPPRSNSEKFHVLSEIVASRLDELLNQLGVDLRPQGRTLAGPCPVHGGNNPGACQIYPDGYSMKGNWVCYTRHCENVFYKTIIGFVRGVLSNRRGYAKPGDPVVPFMDAVHYLCKFIGQDFDELRLDKSEFEKKRFIAHMEGLRPKQQRPLGWKKEDILARMECPSPYFLSRGFSRGVLTRFMAGDWLNPNPAGEMFNRAVVPILSPDGKRVVGVSGRSKNSSCLKCGLYHPVELPACPTEEDKKRFSKWRHNEGFYAHGHLYNLDGASPRIRSTGKVVLVESPGNVWRLTEAGVENAVAQFGSNLEDEQQILLEASGAMTIFLGFDDDKAGKRATETIIQQLGRVFRVVPIKGIRGDLAEMSVEEVKTIIVPQLR